MSTPNIITHVASLSVLFPLAVVGVGCSDGSSAGAGSTASASSASSGAHGGGGGGAGGGQPVGSGGAGGGGPMNYLAPNPIVSRNKPAFSNHGIAKFVNDGEYKTGRTWDGTPTGGEAWVAIQVGAHYDKLLLSWTASGNYNYTDTLYGAPGDYRIETSADSTNGTDGMWKTVATVTNNPVRTRAHSFDFKGQSWVRFVVTQEVKNEQNGVQIDEIDIHDVSRGSDDTWFFMGDSITAFAYDRQTPLHQPSYAADVNAEHAAYYPAMINGGVDGDLTDNGVSDVDPWIQLNPDYHYFAIEYGTNDSWGNKTDTTKFRANLQAIIDKLKAAGKVPVLAHIPFSPDGNHETVPTFNQVIDDLAAKNGLPTGPDLYAWFKAHPTSFVDKVHPDDAGRVAMNELWYESMKALYAP